MPDSFTNEVERTFTVVATPREQGTVRVILDVIAAEVTSANALKAERMGFRTRVTVP